MKVKINKMLEERNMTVADLAFKVQTNEQTIRNWASENTKVDPSLKSCDLLCKAFNCSISDLLEPEDVKIARTYDELEAENVALRKELEEFKKLKDMSNEALAKFKKKEVDNPIKK